MAVDHELSREHAKFLDNSDPLRHLRSEFKIPSRSDLKRSALPAPDVPTNAPDDPSIYLCGNSLGVQPKRTSTRVSQFLTSWSIQGVFGHFKKLSDSPLDAWLDLDGAAARRVAPIVGALPSEVAVMGTLTANLHVIMSAFYRPDPKGRYKIIIESKAFPSDHYAAESQAQLHNLSPSEAVITINPPDPLNPVIPTEHILSVIDAHAESTALLLLPGIQFYTGQYLDIAAVTAHARARGIFVVWDLAHAAGNVDLRLHDWDVDAAAWCSYKYLNCGPGGIGGLFVHSRHTPTAAQGGGDPGEEEEEEEEKGSGAALRSLRGWWGSDKSARFAMDNKFVAIPGAAGFQLSNPSALDLTSLNASLEVFGMTDMAAVRRKSESITRYLEVLLLVLLKEEEGKEENNNNNNNNDNDNDNNGTSSGGRGHPFRIITPADPGQRGAQLSLKLRDGLLNPVMASLEEDGVVVDERRPDVIRVAPAPLYNSYEDVWRFVDVFKKALITAGALSH